LRGGEERPRGLGSLGNKSGRGQGGGGLTEETTQGDQGSLGGYTKTTNVLKGANNFRDMGKKRACGGQNPATGINEVSHEKAVEKRDQGEIPKCGETENLFRN